MSEYVPDPGDYWENDVYKPDNPFASRESFIQRVKPDYRSLALAAYTGSSSSTPTNNTATRPNNSDYNNNSSTNSPNTITIEENELGICSSDINISGKLFEPNLIDVYLFTLTHSNYLSISLSANHDEPLGFALFQDLNDTWRRL